MARKEIYFSDVFTQLDVLLACAESDGQYSIKGEMARICFVDTMVDYMAQRERDILDKYSSALLSNVA